ncbi:MAG: hypothetical protein FWG02_08135 [Holophagaceae bacterium]|nr:hypothetical protein [Holophagaceae bacterium]
MNPLFMLAYIFISAWPQEAPPKQEPPTKQAPPPKKEEPPKQAPPQKKEDPPNAAREAALAAISGAKPVSEEKHTPIQSSQPSTPAKTSNAGSTGRSNTSRTTSPRPSTVTVANSANTVASPHGSITDAEREASVMLIANALYQAELAKRSQIISVDTINSPEAALAELEAGNIRFMKGWRVRTLMAAQDVDLRATLEKGQSPFAVVVTCSDSRAMDNIIFDQELGRLFSIRIAGNSPDTLGIASIEYAVEHLASKVVIVMGHTKCGAIGAVADAHGHPLPENMHIFQDLMKGLLEEVPRDPNESEEAYKDRLEKENAKRQAKAIYDQSNIVRELVDEKKIWLLPASYDLSTGLVTFFNPIVGKSHGVEEHVNK